MKTLFLILSLLVVNAVPLSRQDVSHDVYVELYPPVDGLNEESIEYQVYVRLATGNVWELATVVRVTSHKSITVCLNNITPNIGYIRARCRYGYGPYGAMSNSLQFSNVEGDVKVKIQCPSPPSN